MANNYIQFAADIEELTPEEEQWLQEQLDLDTEDMEAKEVEARLQEMGFTGEFFEWPGFNYEISTDNQTKQKSVLFYSEECGNIDNVLGLVRAFILRFRPAYSFAVGWAETCSKMRPGQFGGGAAIVTKDGIRYVSSTQWLIKEMELLTGVDNATQDQEQRLS